MGHVYVVRSTKSHKVYVGKTENSLELRWYQHCQSARFGSKSRFAMAIRKYGHESFSIQPLFESDDPAELSEMEKYWIDKLQSSITKKGWNISLGGSGYPGKRSLETKTKQSRTHKEKWAKRTPEERRAIGQKIRATRIENDTYRYKKESTLKGRRYARFICEKCGLSISVTRKITHERSHSRLDEMFSRRE